MSEIVPEGWSEYSLEQLGQVVGGGTPASEKSEYWGGSVMWATPTEITKLKGRYISKTVRTLSEKGLQSSSAKLHPSGTILLTSRASIGYPAINLVPMATNQGFQSIRPNEKLDIEYGYQLLLQNRPSLVRLSAGSTFLEISSKEISKFKLPIPPLPEQKKIASILTSVDEVIETTQRQIDKLQDLKKATMNELLTKGIGHTEFKAVKGWTTGRIENIRLIPSSWELVYILDVAKLESGHTPSRHIPEYWGGNLGWLSLHDTKAMDVFEIEKTALKVTQLGIDNSSARILPKHTVALSRTATVGKCVLLGNDMATSQDFANFVCSEKLDPFFLMLMFRHMQDTWKNLSGGSTHETIYMPIFKKLQIVLPPIAEQRKVVGHILSIDGQINTIKQKLQQTQSLKKSLMQDLLTGKVRVKVN